MDLIYRIEALLFTEGGSLAKKKLLQILEITPEQLSQALISLAARREGTGLAIIQSDTEVALTVSPEAAETIEKAFEKEVGREIGDAGLEVLSIILYRGPSTRAQIDYIRGVNTSSTMRTLTSRGLIERMPNPKDAREYLYRPTTELLAHLGVRDMSELPEYAKISSELAAFEQTSSPFESNGDNDTQADLKGGN